MKNVPIRIRAIIGFIVVTLSVIPFFVWIVIETIYKEGCVEVPYELSRFFNATGSTYKRLFEIFVKGE